MRETEQYHTPHITQDSDQEFIVVQGYLNIPLVTLASEQVAKFSINSMLVQDHLLVQEHSVTRMRVVHNRLQGLRSSSMDYTVLVRSSSLDYTVLANYPSLARYLSPSLGIIQVVMSESFRLLLNQVVEDNLSNQVVVTYPRRLGILVGLPLLSMYLKYTILDSEHDTQLGIELRITLAKDNGSLLDKECGSGLDLPLSRAVDSFLVLEPHQVRLWDSGLSLATEAPTQ